MADDRLRLELKIKEIVAEALDCEPNEFESDADLFEEHGLDSIGITMVYVDLSLLFGIPEPPADADLSGIRSVVALADYVDGQDTKGNWRNAL